MPDLIITPNRSFSATGIPEIDFVGASGSGISLQVLQNGSVTFIANPGGLFSINNSLTGSLFGVSDIAGLPILEVFSDDRVVAGAYNTNALFVSGSGVAFGVNYVPSNVVLLASGNVNVTGGILNLASSNGYGMMGFMNNGGALSTIRTNYTYANGEIYLQPAGNTALIAAPNQGVWIGPGPTDNPPNSGLRVVGEIRSDRFYTSGGTNLADILYPRSNPSGYITGLAGTGSLATLAQLNSLSGFTVNIVSGGLENRIVQTGNSAVAHANSIGSTISGNLSQTGAALISRDLAISGALQALITEANSDVNSINGQSGTLVITGAGIVSVISGGVGLITISGDTSISGFVTSVSGGLEVRITQTGNASVAHANSIGSTISGNLTQTGVTLFNRDASISGGLDARITATGNSAVAHANALYGTNIVYTTGNQGITGIKIISGTLRLARNVYLDQENSIFNIAPLIGLDPSNYVGVSPNFSQSNGAYIGTSSTLFAQGGANSVGIGTSSPVSRLTVSGKITAYTDDPTTTIGSFGNSNGLVLRNTSSTVGALNGLLFANKDNFASAVIYVQQTNNGNSGDKMFFITKQAPGASWNAGMVLDTNNFLGVGTATPLAGIHATGFIRSDVGYLSGTTNLAELFYPRQTNPSGYVTSADLGSIVYTTGNQIITALKTFSSGAVSNGENAGFIVDAGGFRRVGLVKYPGLEAGLIAQSGIITFLGRRPTGIDLLSPVGVSQEIVRDLILTSSGYILISNNTTSTVVTANEKLHVKDGNVRYDNHLLSGAINIADIFYPRNNPSGFITGLAETGSLATLAQLNSLSGWAAPGAANYVYITGNQAITGLKTFTERIAVGENVGVGSGYFGNGGWRNNPVNPTTLYLGRTPYFPTAPFNTSDIGLIYSVSDTGIVPSKPGLVLYNNDTGYNGWTPLMVFAKAESGPTIYKASLAAIGAYTVSGSAAASDWIDGNLVFYTSRFTSEGLVPAMIITSSGFVGIGTNPNPLTPLHVSGGFIRSDAGFRSGSTNLEDILYPRSNPSGFITGLAGTGSLATLAQLNSLSGWAAPGAANYVYTTGQQSITGQKTFIDKTVIGNGTTGSFGVGSTTSLNYAGIEVRNGNFVKHSTFGYDGTWDNIIRYAANGDPYATTGRFLSIDGTVTAGASNGNQMRFSIWTGLGTAGGQRTVLTLRGDNALVYDGTFFSGSTSIADIFASQTALTNTGSTLNTRINSLSGWTDTFFVHRTGEELISGNKTFAGNISFNSGIYEYQKTVTANYSVLWTDTRIYCDNTNPITLTLPSSPSQNSVNPSGMVLKIKLLNTGSVLLTGNFNTFRIDGSASYIMVGQYTAREIHAYGGTNWYVW